MSSLTIKNIHVLCTTNSFTTRSYMLPVDNELADKLGIEDREQFGQFYEVLYELMENDVDDQCNADAFANDEQKQEMEANYANDANYDANYANE